MRSRDRLFGTKTRLRIGRHGIRVPTGHRDFCLPAYVQTGPEVHRAAYRHVPGFFPEGKAVGT